MCICVCVCVFASCMSKQKCGWPPFIFVFFTFAGMSVSKASSPASFSLVSRLPALKRTGDSDADQEAQHQREAFIRVVTNLWNKPKHALMCDSWLTARIANAEKKQEVHEEHRFVDAPECISKIDHDWVCGYVKEKVALTDAQFGKIKAYDTQAPFHLLCQFLNCTMMLKLPPACIDKRVLKATLNARHDMNPVRLQACKGAEWMEDSGKVNWGLIGSFTLVFEGGILVQIVHRGTGVATAVDKDLGVDHRWELENNWCDNKARLIRDAARKYFVMESFFGKRNTAARALPCWTGSEQRFEALCAEAVKAQAVVDSLAKSRGEVADLGEEFTTPLKSKQQEAAKRARTQLLASNDARAAKRRVSVVSAVVPNAKAAPQAVTPEAKRSGEGVKLLFE